MKNPLISVVIPITRYEFELEEALVSVFEQTEQRFEVILVDNHATQGTKKIAEIWKLRHPERLRIVEELKVGLVSARNRGLAESQGEFVALLDSDDKMKKDRLQRQLACLLADPEVTLLGSWTDEISSDGQSFVTKDSPPKIPRWASYLLSGTERWSRDPFYEPRPSTFFFRKKVLGDFGPFDPRFDPFWLEDTEFSFRMYERGKVAIVPESLVEYRLHPPADSVRRIFDLGLVAKHNIFFSILREKYFVKGDLRSESRFRKLRSRWLRETGVKILAYPKGERFGKNLIRDSFKDNPLDIQSLLAFLRIYLPEFAYPRAFGVKGPIDGVLPEFVDEKWVKTLFSLDE